MCPQHPQAATVMSVLGFLQGGDTDGVLLLEPNALSPGLQQRLWPLPSPSLHLTYQGRRRETRLAGFDTCGSGRMGRDVGLEQCQHPGQDGSEFHPLLKSGLRQASFTHLPRSSDSRAGKRLEWWDLQRTTPRCHPSLLGIWLHPTSPLMAGDLSVHLEL